MSEILKLFPLQFAAILSIFFITDRVGAEDPPVIDEDLFAVWLTELAIACRYDGPHDELGEQLASFSRQLRASGRKPTPEEWVKHDTITAQWEAEGKLAGRAEKARVDLENKFAVLVRVHDPSVIKLIAPLLGEHSKVFFHEDYSNPGPEKRAANTLGALVDKGVAIPNAPHGRGHYDPEVWRHWWAENRARYEPIPAPLQALEANQRQYYGGHAPAVSATPPPKPSSNSTPAPKQPTSGTVAPEDEQTAPRHETFLSHYIAIAVAAVVAVWFMASRNRARP